MKLLKLGNTRKHILKSKTRDSTDFFSLNPILKSPKYQRPTSLVSFIRFGCLSRVLSLEYQIEQRVSYKKRVYASSLLFRSDERSICSQKCLSFFFVFRMIPSARLTDQSTFRCLGLHSDRPRHSASVCCTNFVEVKVLQKRLCPSVCLSVCLSGCLSVRTTEIWF